VKAFERTAAIFDLDDSLLDGNSGAIFTWFLYSDRHMLPEYRSRIPRAVYDYARGRLSESDMVSLGSRCQAGLRADVARDLARACFTRHIRKRVTHEGLRAVRRHLLSGHFVLLASGSPQFIVEEVGQFLRVHLAIGTRAAIREGVITDELVPPVVFREGKRERVKEIAAQYGLSLESSWLYSDSSADVPLFEQVGHPVVVNPKDEFRAEADRRGWEVQAWKGRWEVAEPRAGAGAGSDFPEEEWASWET
jgi:HAD superfamily hydrolase (TIGR01490 family)